MARKDPEQEVTAPEAPQETEQIEQAQPGVVEVEINLQLVNQKLNFVIAKLDEISNLMAQAQKD